MGEVISRRAAADDIFADVGTTLTRAQARGGKWQALAADSLGDTMKLVEATRARRAAAQAEATVKRAALEAEDDRADRLLARVSDEIWNAVGRPAADPALSVLFPGGFAYYADGMDDEQPHRMELLASLLESKLHPKLSAEAAQAFAAEIRQEAAALRAVHEPATAARAQVDLQERVWLSLARTAQMTLANLKRRLKAEGFSEAEIHQVIPDRPKPVAAPAAAPAPAPGPATQSPSP
jgi:hypothetical protein